MADFILLTSQRNEIMRTVLNHSLSPSEFVWEAVDSVRYFFGRVPELRHPQTGFYFTFDRIEYNGGESGFFVSYSPGYELLRASQDVGSWVNVVNVFDKWLTFVERETEAPDLWNELVHDTQLIKDAEQQPPDNLPFTEEELPRVRQALLDIKEHIYKANQISETQRKRIDARFDYLEQKASEFGRKDFLNLFLGVLLSVGVDALRNGNSVRDLFVFAREVFKQLLGTVFYLGGLH